MHIAKVAALLVLTLVAMRAISWGIGWTLARNGRTGRRFNAVAANAAGLAIFTGVLAWNLLPGESFDTAALLFGLIVYTLCVPADLRWPPGQPREAR